MTPCREYQGYRNRKGYGIRSWGRKRFGTQLVHRQIMLMAGHDIEGKVVMHVCDNPACFRYDHLRITTQGDNLRDMFAKGRNNNRKGYRSPIKHGTHNGYAQHRRYNEDACELCKAAENAYSREMKARHS